MFMAFGDMVCNEAAAGFNVEFDCPPPPAPPPEWAWEWAIKLWGSPWTEDGLEEETEWGFLDNLAVDATKKLNAKN